MEVTEQKGLLRTCLIVGGTVLSFSLGAIAFQKFRRFPERTQPVRERGFSEYEIKTTDQRPQETNQERHDGSSANRPPLTSWTQTFEEVMIEIPVGPDVKSKDVRCTFNTKSLEINVKSCQLLKGLLHQDITPDECSWEIEGAGAGRVLTVSLIKGTFQRGHWTQVLTETDDEEMK